VEGSAAQFLVGQFGNQHLRLSQGLVRTSRACFCPR
jgi:hypothetical protein